VRQQGLDRQISFSLHCSEYLTSTKLLNIKNSNKNKTQILVFLTKLWFMKDLVLWKKKSPIVKFYLVNAKLSIFFRGVADSNAWFQVIFFTNNSFVIGYFLLLAFQNTNIKPFVFNWIYRFFMQLFFVCTEFFSHLFLISQQLLLGTKQRKPKKWCWWRAGGKTSKEGSATQNFNRLKY